MSRMNRLAPASVHISTYVNTIILFSTLFRRELLKVPSASAPTVPRSATSWVGPFWHWTRSWRVPRLLDVLSWPMGLFHPCSTYLLGNLENFPTRLNNLVTATSGPDVDIAEYILLQNTYRTMTSQMTKFEPQKYIERPPTSS